jgi:uncharacterized protein (TIGR03382 family)
MPGFHPERTIRAAFAGLAWVQRTLVRCPSMKLSPTYVCVAALTATVALPLLLPQAVAACTPLPPNSYDIVADASDTEPPSTPEVGRTRIYRAARDSSCGPQASVEFEVSATDDKTHPAEIGYLLEVVGDEAGVWVEGRPVNGISGDVSARFRDDGRGSDFEIDIWSVDRAGNMSEKAERVRVVVEADEKSDEGCSTTAARPVGVASPLLLLLVAWQLRRRRRPA